MDYGKVTQSVDAVIKTAAGSSDDFTEYDKIPAIDEQREMIVSHLKQSYHDETGNALSGKELSDASQSYKNMLKGTDGEIERLHGHVKEVEARIATAQEDLNKSDQIRRILQVLVVTAAIVTGIYATGSSYAHVASLAVLLTGFAVVLYTRGEAARFKSFWDFAYSNNGYSRPSDGS
jgi:hypothetical protein